MTFKYRYRKQILITIFITILLAGSIFSYINFKPKKKEKNNRIISLDKKVTKTTKINKNSSNKKDNLEKIMVDVKGEVVNPGIYELNTGERVIDAINRAGGTTANGDTSVLNLSKKLKDEMVIIVYSFYQVKNFSYVKETETKEINACKEGINDIKNDACNEENNSNSKEIEGKISINTATKEELMNLPGIGESKALNIIKYREENGLFKSIEDIKNVTGIGDSLFAKIKENITT